MGRTDVVVKVLGDAAAIVDHLDDLEAVLGEAHLWDVVSKPRAEILRHGPMLVAPASRLFSTSSFTAVWRSTTT